MAVATGAFGAATLSADTVESTVSGGTLTATTFGATFGAITLNAANQDSTGTSSSAWSLKDARGTGAAWTLTVTGTDWTSAAGSVDTVVRTIAVGRLTLDANETFTAGTDSDATTNITGQGAVVLTTSAQTLIASSGTNKGTYTVTPLYTLSVPANAFRSNFVTGSSGTQQPYTATLTYSIA